MNKAEVWQIIESYKQVNTEEIFLQEEVKKEIDELFLSCGIFPNLQSKVSGAKERLELILNYFRRQIYQNICVNLKYCERMENKEAVLEICTALFDTISGIDIPITHVIALIITKYLNDLCKCKQPC